MGSNSKWETEAVEFGMQTVTLNRWEYFHDFIREAIPQEKVFVYRGHRCDEWLLESTFDRLLKLRSILTENQTDKKVFLEHHYRKFRYAIRGRRGTHAPELKGDYIWALGRHYALATPLLDWTTSPYVAAFFAFIEEGEPQTSHRVVFAAAKDDIQESSMKMRQRDSEFEDVITFFSPFSDENPRLVNQGGLFSRLPVGLDLEEWFRKYWGAESESPFLLKIRIPDEDAEKCLRSLALMNINHLTLFPDLQGASEFCNTALKVEGYNIDLGEHPSPYQTISGRRRRR